MKVKYHGKSFGGGYTGITDGKEYVCLGVEYDLLRIVDDEGEDYLYSASAPAPLSSPKDGGKWEITEDTDNVLKTVIGNNEWNGYKGKVLNEVQSYDQFFCDEPIIAVYSGMGEYEDEGNSFLDCYHDLAYHVTEGHRLVLETEHFYLSLDVRGVSKCDKTSSIEELEQPGEWLDPCIHELEEDESPWVDYESTLFVGERLLQVENTSGYYLLHFDDFDLKVVPHALNEEDFPGLNRADDWSYNHVYGAERHLKNKCSCGGEGELLLDFVSDYVVRCKKCKKSSWAEMTAIEAIKGWNAGDIQCDLSDITIE